MVWDIADATDWTVGGSESPWLYRWMILALIGLILTFLGLILRDQKGSEINPSFVLKKKKSQRVWREEDRGAGLKLRRSRSAPCGGLEREESKLELFGGQKIPFLPRKSEAKEDPKEGESQEEVFLDNGRFRRTFARAKAVGVQGSVVFRALHRLEREWYAVRRMMVVGEPQVRETVKKIKGLTELFHPNILTCITSWAEDWKGRTTKMKIKPSLLPQSTVGLRESEGYDKSSGVGRLLVREGPSEGAKSRKKFAIFVQMELGRGEQLGRYLRRHTPSSAEALFIFGEIAKGLAYLHSRGIAHHRLDPEHIFLRGDCIKLAFHGVERPRPGAEESDIFSLGRLLSQLVRHSLHEREPHLLVQILTNPDPDKRPKAAQIFAMRTFVAWGEKVARDLGPQDDPVEQAESEASWRR